MDVGHLHPEIRRQSSVAICIRLPSLRPIMLILIVAGLVEENEDKILIKQRSARGRAHDAELGITRKPAWWRKTAVDYMSPDERLRNMTKNFGRGDRRSQQSRGSRDIQLEDMPSGGEASSPPPYSSEPTSPALGVSSGTAPVVGLRDRSRSRPGEEQGPFRDQSPASLEATPLRPGIEDHRRGSTLTTNTQGSGSSGMTGTTLNMPQQKVRSMLDV